MNSDTLLRQIAEADIYGPEHELSESARTSTVALTEIRRRIDTMDAKELTKPVEQEQKPRSGWLVAAVAFAAIVVVAGVAALLTRSEPVEPATTTPSSTTASPSTTVAPADAAEVTSTTIAEVAPSELQAITAYESAFNSNDEQAYRALLDSQVRLPADQQDNVSGRDVAWLVAFMDHAAGQEMRVEFDYDSCRVAGDRVACDALHIGEVQRILAKVDELVRYFFVIEEGTITELELRCQICAPNVDEADSIRMWVTTQNPQEASQMFRLPGVNGTYESGQLWLKWAPLWVEAGRPPMGDNY